jgi:hypothetical protein
LLAWVALLPQSPAFFLCEAVRIFGALFTAYSLRCVAFDDLREVLLTWLCSEVEWSAEERAKARRAFFAYSHQGRSEYGAGGKASAVADFIEMLQNHRFFGFHRCDRACLWMLKQVSRAGWCWSGIVLFLGEGRCRVFLLSGHAALLWWSLSP